MFSSFAFILTWIPVTLTFIIILALLVIFHEFGHFIMAKLFKIGVEEFGIGFPPRLFGIKKGETLYSVNAIPLGGFVKLRGEIDAEPGDKKAFVNKKPFPKFVVLVMGVVMNIILAIVALMIGFSLGMPVYSNHDTSLPYRGVKSIEVRVADIEKDSAAEQLDIKKGDVIIGSLDTEYYSVSAVRNYIHAGQDKKVLKLSHDGQPYEITFTGLPQDKNLGILMEEKASYSWWAVPYIAAIEGVKLTGLFISMFASIFGDLFTHGVVPSDLSGPVGIFMYTREAVQSGILEIIKLVVLLSINLAIINILPFPALDGGRLVFVIIEKIRGKRVAAKVENAIHNIGFFLLILLIILITCRDVIRLR